MNHSLYNFLQTIDNLIWGPPLLLLLVGTGVYFTFRLGAIQLSKLPLALSYVFKKEEGVKGNGDVSSFAALCTALSATIGTGNIVGVATALKLGGPGALFWMWMAALFGMATKYAECLLAVKYREKDAKGNMLGGPMLYLEKGAGKKWLARLFAFFTIGVACFGIGTFPQVNAIVDASYIAFHIPHEITAIVLTILVAAVTIGGIKSIAGLASKVIPTMTVVYVTACVGILINNAGAIPSAISLIVESAFTGQAASGGFVGATIMMAIQAGVARGVFSNESGLGSAPMAAASAQTNSCVRQGLISMVGTFLDTIVICSMTGLALVLTGVWSMDIEGAKMTTEAFSLGLNEGFGPIIVAIGLMFFAFTTILGWNYYGERCVVYLFGERAVLVYKLVFVLLVLSGAFIKLDMIWLIADIVNGLMAVPNLIGLILLRHVVAEETRLYFAALKERVTGSEESTQVKA
ncbi:alanine/glycine:cation symporter family protein [Enterovibrio paralichthyis]|uniref:alanine/glycine:cation symporter family protein n=1 Tax=Enterovibrio paralichthyis TaxID=2853805 RepID=UPI001C4899A9|nr:sodium:alanine symporter family protein [Enterovibrio paralichthyis]MBV7297008.1 sodium:alanine symporter family protein [Enterovibrio paralichthyis]